MIFELMGNNQLLEMYRDSNFKKHKIIHKHDPYFYVPTDEVTARVKLWNGVEDVVPGYTSLYGDEVTKIVVDHPSVVPRIRDKFSKTFEANIPYLRRCVIDCIDKVKNDHYVTMYFDLETEVIYELLDPRNRITSVACYDTLSKQYKVFMWHPKKHGEFEVDGTIQKVYETEGECLHAFAKYVKRIDPDILTAYNLFGFDLVVLDQRIGNSNLSDFGQGDSESIKGRLCVDIADIYKTLSGRSNIWKLQDVAVKELGVGKVELEENVYQTWLDGKLKELREYNLVDVVRIVELDEKLDLIRYVLDLQQVGGVPFGDAQSPSPIIEALLMRNSTKVMPSRVKHREVKVKGGLVLDPKSGIHSDVTVFDFKAEYPSAIIGWNISPETLDPEGDIEVGNGTRFSSKIPGIMPAILEDLLALRARYKKEGQESKQKAVKRVANATYGVCAWPKFMLYRPEVANAITFIGRWLNGKAKEFFDSLDINCEVIYGDTDSIFVKGLGDGQSYTEDLNIFLTKEVFKMTGRDSTVEIEYETTFDKVLLSSKKRYCGRTLDGELITKGMDIVRTNAAKISQKAQSELITLAFDKPEEMDRYISDIKSGFKDLPLSDIAIPQRVRATKNVPHYRAKIRGQEHGVIFDPFLPIFLLYTKGKVGEIPYHNDFPIADYPIDYSKMWDRVVVAKLDPILAFFDKRTPPYRKTLEDWVKKV